MNPHNIPPLSEFRYQTDLQIHVSVASTYSDTSTTPYTFPSTTHREGMVLQQHP